MGLVDALETLQPKASGKTCTVAYILEQLDGADREALIATMASGDRRPSDIADVVTRAGYPVSQYVIARHSRGDCKCPR